MRWLNEWVLVNLIIALASLLQAITGFGFAIMATPFLLLVIDSRECIQISIFLSFFIAGVMVPKIKADIDWLLLKRLSAGSLAGAPAGLWLFVSLPVNTVKVFVAVTVLIVALFALFSRPRLLAGQEEGLLKRYRAWIETAVGFASGLLTASIGMPGVPLAMYFAQGHLGKEQIRSTTLAFFVVIYTVSMVLQGVAGQIYSQTVLSSLGLVPAALLGIVAGDRLFGKLNQQRFRLLVNVILLYTGLHMLSSVL